MKKSSQRVARAWFIGGLLFVSTACGSRTRPTSIGAVPGEDREVHVLVKNDNFYDIRVYHCRGTQGFRLGTVSSSSEREFSFQWTGSELKIMVDFIGAGQLRFVPISVSPGERVLFRIGATMHNQAGSVGCGS